MKTATDFVLQLDKIMNTFDDLSKAVELVKERDSEWLTIIDGLNGVIESMKTRCK